MAWCTSLEKDSYGEGGEQDFLLGYTVRKYVEQIQLITSLNRHATHFRFADGPGRT